MKDNLREGLREAYGRRAKERDGRAVQPWKDAERRRFLELLREEGKGTLLELGAGPGKDGGFFRDHGLDVVCTDLSPEMVALCEGKNLTAYVMDLSDLTFPSATFDAVYALNCLLHLPGRELPQTLRGIRGVLKPGGLFYLGVYGGREHEGVWEDDPYEPKRFFSFHTDERLREIVAGVFEILSFNRLPLDAEKGAGLCFQALILRKHQ